MENLASRKNASYVATMYIRRFGKPPLLLNAGNSYIWQNNEPGKNFHKLNFCHSKLMAKLMEI